MMAIGRRIRDYFVGRRLRLATRLPPDEAARRINDGAASILSPFATGVIGWARFGRIRLRYRRSLWWRSDARPILAGRIRADRGGSLIHLNYRGPLPLIVFLPFWYAALVLMAVVFLASVLSSGVETAFVFAFPLMLVVMLIFPAALVRFSLTRADADFEEMLAFLRTSLAARGIPPVVDDGEAGR
jgi:hypothetical protein